MTFPASFGETFKIQKSTKNNITTLLSSLTLKTVKHFAVQLPVSFFLSTSFKNHTAGKVCVRAVGEKEAKIEKRMNALIVFEKAEKRQCILL